MIRVRFYLGSSPLPKGPGAVRRTGISPILDRSAKVAEVLATHGIDGATITPSLGLWKGDLEPSLVIEGTGPRYPDPPVRPGKSIRA